MLGELILQTNILLTRLKLFALTVVMNHLSEALIEGYSVFYFFL